jgi:hypothetical protein
LVVVLIVDRFAFTQEQRGADEVVFVTMRTPAQNWVHADNTLREYMGATARAPRRHRTTPGPAGCDWDFTVGTFHRKKIWSRNVLEEAGAARNTECGSPLVPDDRWCPRRELIPRWRTTGYRAYASGPGKP